MEPELAIESSREAIRVCLMIGGPILAVCLVVGLLMGLAQAMSHIQDQALATIPKILAIFAVVGFALPWFADQMIEFARHQFSRPMMAVSSSGYEQPKPNVVRSLLDTEPVSQDGYYKRPEVPALNPPLANSSPVFKNASFINQRTTSDQPKLELPPLQQEVKQNNTPFSLPSYRFTRRPSENIEG